MPKTYVIKTPSTKICDWCEKNFSRKNETNVGWAHKIYCTTKCGGKAYLAQKRAVSQAEKDRTRATFSIRTPGDLYLYTYKPETTVCGVRG